MWLKIGTETFKSPKIWRHQYIGDIPKKWASIEYFLRGVEINLKDQACEITSLFGKKLGKIAKIPKIRR